MWESLHTVRKYLWRYRRGMALGGFCLVMKDLAQALQPLMIRGAVDSFRGGGTAFLRFAGYLVGLAADDGQRSSVTPLVIVAIAGVLSLLTGWRYVLRSRDPARLPLPFLAAGAVASALILVQIVLGDKLVWIYGLHTVPVVEAIRQGQV